MFSFIKNIVSVLTCNYTVLFVRGKQDGIRVRPNPDWSYNFDISLDNLTLYFCQSTSYSRTICDQTTVMDVMDSHQQSIFAL